MVIFHCYVSLPEGIEIGGKNGGMFLLWRAMGLDNWLVFFLTQKISLSQWKSMNINKLTNSMAPQ